MKIWSIGGRRVYALGQRGVGSKMLEIAVQTAVLKVQYLVNKTIQRDKLFGKVGNLAHATRFKGVAYVPLVRYPLRCTSSPPRNDEATWHFRLEKCTSFAEGSLHAGGHIVST